MTATRWLLAAVLPVVAAGMVLSESVGYRTFALGVLIVGSVGFWAEGRTRAASRRAAPADETDNGSGEAAGDSVDSGDCTADSGPDGR